MSSTYLFQVLAGTVYMMAPILLTFCGFLCLRGLPSPMLRRTSAESHACGALLTRGLPHSVPRSFESLAPGKAGKRRASQMQSDHPTDRPETAGQPARWRTDKAPDESAAPGARSTCHLWHPLPGMCLALGATGFEIGLETHGPMAGAFVLWSPEGKGLFAGPNLDEFKHIAEQQAIYREQFRHEPMATPWHRTEDD